MSEKTENIKKENNDEIDLIEVFSKIWAGRKTIYKSMGVCFVIGLIIALGTPKEYKSEVTLMVETSSGNNGMSGLLQQVSGLSGLNLGGASGGTDALKPDLYPDVIRSTPFLLEVLNQKVTESKYDSTLTVAQYLNRHTHHSLMGNIMSFPGKIIGAIHKNKKNQQPIITTNNRQHHPLLLTPEQSGAIGALGGSIKTKEGESNNTLMISVEMQDPMVAAQLTDSVVKSLTKYVTDYRTHKAKNDLQFVVTSHAEAEIKYKQTQRALAAYSDQNKNVILASAKAEEQRLQAEYTLAFNVYNTLSQQLEQAKLKVQQETPVFTVLNPAQVSMQKSKPNTSLIMMGMILLGGLIGTGLILGRSLIKIS